MSKQKKVYESPKVETYGGLREITNAVGAMGLADGGMGMTSKTSA